MAEVKSDSKHPSGLYVLFVTEMWERFSYYGMRALFVLFMTKALLFDKALGSQIYGSYTGLVYLTPLLGDIWQIDTGATESQSSLEGY